MSNPNENGDIMQEVKKLGVLSVALMVGALYAVLGFIFGIIFAIVGAAAFGLIEGAGGYGFLFGALAIVFFPIIYGILGFILGAICAFLYNVLAGWLGGIKVELVESG